jgi:anti-sigma factor RsiW
MDCHEAIDMMGDAIDGHLPPALQSGFDEHMAECRPCATYLGHLKTIRTVLQHLPREGGTSPHRQELLDAYRKVFESDAE